MQIITLLADRYAEPRVVHHAQHAPVHVTRLQVHALIHGAQQQVLGAGEVGDGDVEPPEAPAEASLAPRHVERAAVQLTLDVAVPVLGVVDVRQPPGAALVEGQLDARDAPPAAAVRVPARPVRLGPVDQAELLVVRRVGDGRVGAEIVDGVALVLPPFGLVGGFFGADHGGQDTVVVDVVVVVARLRAEDEPAKPLHAASSDLARDDGAERLAVIRPQGLTVHLVRKHDAAVRVHGPVELDIGGVVTVRLIKVSAIQ